MLCHLISSDGPCSGCKVATGHLLVRVAASLAVILGLVGTEQRSEIPAALREV